LSPRTAYGNAVPAIVLDRVPATVRSILHLWRPKGAEDFFPNAWGRGGCCDGALEAQQTRVPVDADQLRGLAQHLERLRWSTADRAGCRRRRPFFRSAAGPAANHVVAAQLLVVQRTLELPRAPCRGTRRGVTGKYHDACHVHLALTAGLTRRGGRSFRGAMASANTWPANAIPPDDHGNHAWFASARGSSVTSFDSARSCLAQDRAIRSTT
jgi:hypothetical protein